jgi:hypothetical protein
MAGTGGSLVLGNTTAFFRIFTEENILERSGLIDPGFIDPAQKK